MGAENIGDQFLIGRPVEHVTLMAVGNAEHFLTIIVITAAFPPQIRRLDGRHQNFLGERGVLLLAHNLFDFFEHPKAQWQPRVNAGTGLLHHAGAQHQTMRNNLRFLGIFTQNRQKILRQAHR